MPPRHAGLERALQRFPAAAEHMKRVHGLEMPAHLAHALGFWLGLDDAERDEAWAYLEGPCGVSQWFLDGMLDRTVKRDVDERLHCRHPDDPAELIAIWNDTDGGHFGLWYEDPRSLPRVVVHVGERGVVPRATTLLASLHSRLAPSDDELAAAVRVHHPRRHELTSVYEGEE